MFPVVCKSDWLKLNKLVCLRGWIPACRHSFVCMIVVGAALVITEVSHLPP